MSSFFTSRDFTSSTTEHPSSAGQKPSEPNRKGNGKMSKRSMGVNKGVGKNLRDNDLPPKRPSYGARMGMWGLSRDWEAQSKQGRREHVKYRGSREEAEDRGRGLFGWGKR